MYKVGKHNAADVFSRQPDYANKVEENGCLFMLQSKLRAIGTVTPESLEPPRGKPNETDCARHISSVSALMGCKPTIRDKFKMDWHELPESSMKETQ